MFVLSLLKIGLFALDVKCIDLPEHIIVGYVNGVSDEWIIIVHGLTTVSEKGIRNFFSSFYSMLEF